jgi:uncharacterized protein YjbI with pentapeptide repeats
MTLHQAAESLTVTLSRIPNSVFDDVNLAAAAFTNVNLAGTHMDDVNLSSLRIQNANLSHATITESCLHGMTINGILVTDLLAAYLAQQKAAALPAAAQPDPPKEL